MRFTSAIAATAALVGSAAAAQTHDIMVGANNSFTFTPNTVDAAPGDMISFTFLTKNHTVTQSSFKTPCAANGSINSGFQPSIPLVQTIPGNFTFLVNDTKPLWFMCMQTGHCAKGMVFSVNAGNGVLPNNTGNTTAAAFMNNAINGSTPTTNSTGNATTSGSGATPSKTSGAGSVARNAAAAIAVVGAAFGLLL